MINGMKNTKKVQKSKSMETAIILWKILKQKEEVLKMIEEKLAEIRQTKVSI